MFLNFELGEISGYKYEDMNGNGILDAGDTAHRGLGHHTVRADLRHDHHRLEGYFEFTGLVYGVYTVTEEDRANWVHMTAVVVRRPDIIGLGRVPRPVPECGAEHDLWLQVRGLVNSDGVWDEGELGIPGWTIYMIWDGDPTVHATTTGR